MAKSGKKAQELIKDTRLAGGGSRRRNKIDVGIESSY